MALTEAQRTEAAEALVRRFAPAAPDSVVVVAKDLLSRTLKLEPSVKQTQFADQQVEWHQLYDLMRRSGATSILASYRRPHARVLQ